MLDSLWVNFWYYCEFYREYALRRWSHITPAEYGMLLIGVGVFGWFLLKSANRK